MFRIMQDTDGLYYVEQDFGGTFGSDWERVTPYYEYLNSAKNWVSDLRPDMEFRKQEKQPIEVGYYIFK